MAEEKPYLEMGKSNWWNERVYVEPIWPGAAATATEKRTLIVKEPPTTRPDGYDEHGNFMVCWRTGQMKGEAGPFATQAAAEAYAALLLTPEHGTIYIEDYQADGMSDQYAPDDRGSWEEIIGEAVVVDIKNAVVISGKKTGAQLKKV